MGGHLLTFIYSEKATKSVDLSYVETVSSISVKMKFCNRFAASEDCEVS